MHGNFRRPKGRLLCKMEFRPKLTTSNSKFRVQFPVQEQNFELWEQSLKFSFRPETSTPTQIEMEVSSEETNFGQSISGSGVSWWGPKGGVP